METDSKNVEDLDKTKTLAKNGWPGAFGIYKTSRTAIMLNLSTLITIYAAVIGFAILFTILRAILFKHGVAFILGQIIYEVVIVGISSAAVYTVIQSVRGKTVQVGEAFSNIYPKVLDIVVVTILIGLMILLSFLLFIIPVFFVAPRLFMALYLVIDKNMKPVEAIKTSWAESKGHVGKVYGIIGVNLLIILPVITIIGILATIYFGIMYYAAIAILYNFIVSDKSSATVAQ